jgi:hypothetical protein
MKQKLYITGLVTVLIIVTGAIFKVNHFPGAGILILIGIATLVLYFIPASLINIYKSEDNRKNIILYYVTWLTCFILFTSMLFKIQHWPYAGLMLAIALPFPYIVFLPVFIAVTSRDKNSNIYNTVAVLLLLALNSVFSGLLALTVSKTQIDDSFNLSRNYNRQEITLSNLLALYPESPVNNQIDKVIDIVNRYQSVLLGSDGRSVDEWRNNAGDLFLADSRYIASEALLDKNKLEVGSDLYNELKELVAVLEETKGYTDVAKAASEIFGFREEDMGINDWSLRIFGENSLAWVLIYLDGLQSNLLAIKTSFY